MVVELVYRTNDPAQWGTGIGRNLTPAEVDQNFYDVEVRLSYIENNPAQAVSIQEIQVNGNQMMIVLTDYTTQGPFLLPEAAFTFTGPFQPNHDYHAYDLLTNNDGLYMVLHDFTSGPSFIFGSDAQGPWYQLLIPFQTRYDVGFFYPGKPGNMTTAGAPMWSHQFSQSVIFLAGLPASKAFLETPPAASLSFPIYQNSTLIGSMQFATGSNNGTFTFAADVNFIAGDRLRVMRPTAIDANAIDLTATIVGKLAGLT